MENGKEAVSCIKQNLKATGFLDQSQVMAMDVMQALRRLETLNRPFDIIFMDPPYRKGFEEKIIPYLLESSLVRRLLWRQQKIQIFHIWKILIVIWNGLKNIRQTVMFFCV